MKLSGQPFIYDLNPYEQNSAQQHGLGAIGVMSNGDLYRYAKINSDGTDLIAGKLVVSRGRESNHANMALSAAASAGDKLVIPTAGATAVDAHEYEEGTLTFNDVSPEGESYFVTSHEANAGSLATDVYLYPALKTAATTSSEVTLVRNPWNNPAISQLIAERAVGIPQTDWDVSVANFGWFKTRGVSAAFQDTGGLTVGYRCTISDQVDGAVGVISDIDAEFEVGQAMQAGTAGEYNPVYLTID